MKEYEEKYIVMLKKARTDEDLSAIINRIYNDGFEDGHNEGENEPKNTDRP